MEHILEHIYALKVGRGLIKTVTRRPPCKILDTEARLLIVSKQTFSGTRKNMKICYFVYNLGTIISVLFWETIITLLQDALITISSSFTVSLPS